jgi:ribonuclease HI
MGVRVSFDGACQPARGGGIATWAFVVEGEGLDVERSGLAAPPGSPEATNNVAEYSGALRGLEYLLERGYHGPVVLQGDSQLVIRQLEGGYRVRADHLRVLHQRVRDALGRFESFQLRWVPRERNARANELTQEALRGAQTALAGPLPPECLPDVRAGARTNTYK